jgi:hypothetical protein
MLFVALALASQVPQPAIEQLPPRPMTLEVSRDPITDLVRATASLLDQGRRLDVACAPQYDGIRVSFTSSHWMAGASILTGERPIVYRFDSDRPRRQIWIIRDRGARFDGARRVTRFLRGLIESEYLLLRTRDVEDHRIDLGFRIVGAAPAISGLLEACGEVEMRRELFDAA